MADTKVEIVEKEEEENEFDINEFLAPENKRMFTTKDYINVAPGFNPTDYFISANYKPIDFAQTNAEIANNPGGAFLHGLTLHHAGEKPDSYASIDGLSYLAGSLIPLLTINRVSAGTSRSLVGRLGFADDAYMVGEGGKLVPRVGGMSKLSANKSQPYKLQMEGPFTKVQDTMRGAPAIRKIMANKAKLDHGIRIAMEAGLWNLSDAELGGLSGYQDALLYTSIGEGLAAGISRVAGRVKNKLRTKGNNANTKVKVDDTKADDYDVTQAAKQADEAIDAEPTIPEGVGPKEKQFAIEKIQELKTVITKFRNLENASIKNTEGFIEAIMRLTPKELEGKIFYDAAGKKGHKVLKDGALETVERYEEALRVAQEVEGFIKPETKSQDKDLIQKATDIVEGIKLLTQGKSEELIAKFGKNFKRKLKRNKKVQDVIKEESSFSDEELTNMAIVEDTIEAAEKQLKLDLGMDTVEITNPYFEFNPKYIAEDVKEIKLTKSPSFKIRAKTPKIKTDSLGLTTYSPAVMGMKAKLGATAGRPDIPYIKQFYSAPKVSDKPGSYYNFLEQEMRQSSVPVNTRVYETMKDLQEASTIIDFSNRASLRTVSTDLITGLSTVKKLLNKIDTRSAKAIEQAEEKVATILSKQPKTTGLEVSNIKFNQVDARPNYKTRTEYNVKNADVTYDFAKTKQGSGATKSAATANKKRYKQVTVNDSGKISNDEKLVIAKSIAEDLLNGNVVNMAGHGAYKSSRAGFTKKVSQEIIDKELLNIFKEVDKILAGRKVSGRIISGGQTGFDEAAIKAANNYKLNVEVNYSGKGLFRPSTGLGAKDDINNLNQFVSRFTKKGTNVKPVIERSMEEIPVTIIRSLETAVSLANETILSRMNPVVARRVLGLKEIIPVRNYNNLLTKLINSLELPKPKPTKTAQQLRVEYLMSGGKIKTVPSKNVELDANAEFSEHLKIQQQKITKFKSTFTDKKIVDYVKKNNPKMSDKDITIAAAELKEQIYTAEYKALTDSDRYIKMYEKNYSPDAYYDTTPEVGSDIIKEETDALFARQADEGIDTGEVVDPTLSKEVLDTEPDGLPRIVGFYDELISGIKDPQFQLDDKLSVIVSTRPSKITKVNKLLPPAKAAGIPLAGRITPMKLSNPAHAAADQLEYMLNVEYNGIPFVNLKEANEYLLPKVKELVPKANITKDGIAYGKNKLLVIKELTDRELLDNPGTVKYVLLDSNTNVSDYLAYVNKKNVLKIKKANPKQRQIDAEKTEVPGTNIENISSGKQLKRSTGGKEIDNLTYIDSRVGKLLDETVDADTWMKADQNFKLNNVPLTYNFVDQLATTMQNAIEMHKVGNLQTRDLMEIIEVALEKRGINPKNLPKDVDYPNIARRKLDELTANIEKAGEANKMGVSAANPIDIIKMKKLMKDYADNMDDITGRNAAEMSALVDEASEIIKQLKDNGYVNSGLMKLDELATIADFLKTQANFVGDANVELFVKQIEDSFRDEYIRSAQMFITKEYGDLKNYFVSDTHKGGSKLQMQMRTQDAADWADTVTEYFQASKELKNDFGTDFESLTKTIRQNPAQREFIKIKMLDFITENPELLENWDVGMGFRPGTQIVKNAEGVRTGTKEVSQLPLVGQQAPGQAGLKFQERYKQMRLGNYATGMDERTTTGAIFRDWMQLMSDNPHIWESFVDRHMLRGKAIDKLYWLNRYASGDDKAKHYILDTIDNEPIINNMKINHLNFIYNNPRSHYKDGNDFVNAGAVDEGINSPIDDVGTPPPPSGGGYYSTVDTPAESIKIPYIGKHFYTDPARIFKKAYQVLGDIRFIDIIDTARNYVNRMAVVPKEFFDWMSQSRLNKSITAWQKKYPDRNWAEEEVKIINTLRDIDYELEQLRVGKDGSRYRLRSQEESMRKRGLTEEEITRGLDAQIQIIKHKEQQTLNTLLSSKLTRPESREIAEAFYEGTRQIRDTRYNDLLTPDLELALKNAGIAEENMPKRIGDLVGYFPRIADGSFKIKLQKGNKYFDIGTSNTSNKEAVQKELIRFLNNEHNAKLLEKPDDYFIHIIPTGRNLSEISDTAMANAVDKSYKYQLGDVKRYLFGKEKLTAGDNIVDFLARAAKHRGDGPMQVTPYKSLEELLSSYWYNNSKASLTLPLTAKIKTVQGQLNKDVQRDLYNYMTDYHNMLIGKKGPVEQNIDNVVNNLMDYAYKIPVVKNKLESLGIYQGSGNLRTLSNLIQRTSSFVALGANVATALLQYTIVGLNVLPRLALDSNSGKILMKAWKHAGGIMNKTSPYNKAYERANLEIFKQDGAVQDILNAGGIRKAGPTRQAFRKLNDWAMWLFQDSDTRSRMFTLVVGVENGKNILKGLKRKLVNRKEVITNLNYKKYLTQDEQLMWLRSQANKTNLKSKVTSPEIKKLIDDYAVDFMEQTNHTYNSFNNPLAFSNPVTKPFLQFKTWVQKEITFFIDAFSQVPSYSGVPMAERYGNAAKIVAAFTTLGGIFSLPGAQELDMATRWAFGVSPKAWMYEQDSPLHDVLAGGFFTLGGVSMEGRTGPGNLVTVIDTDNLFGIYPARLAKAAMAFRDGRTDAALNFALPRFVQNLKQGYDMATTGQLRNTYNGGLTFNVDEMSGNSALNIIYKLAGFQSMDEARYQTLKFAMLDASKSRGRDRRWIYNTIFDYLDEGDTNRARAFARESDVEFDKVLKEYKKKNQPDYTHKTYPYFDKEDEVDKIMGPLFNPKERRLR
tara:strand:+ start:1314 stop:9509 length:8196 start_codon:yes stop_codon:yes gene_type:complete